MSDSKYAAFGELLRRARASTGLSQAGVSRRLGVTSNFYSILERGEKQVSLLKFARLWRILEFDVNELLDSLPVTVGKPRKRMHRESVAVWKGATEGRYIAFGQSLAAARSNAQLTQAELSKAVG